MNSFKAQGYQQCHHHQKHISLTGYRGRKNHEINSSPLGAYNLVWEIDK